MVGIVSISDSLLEWVRKEIINWFNYNGRHFAWRETNDPYHILIAEMLLRRTTATAVSRVFDAFISRFDSVFVLAKSKVDVIAEMVESLGLQNIRAHHLHETANILVREYGGQIPCKFEELKQLPGLGRYGASAVQNFAFNIPTPMVDGNVVHFFKKFFGIQFLGPDDEQAWTLAKRLGGNTHDSRLYWGIIDLVATVCLHRLPRCKCCPLNGHCLFYQSLQVDVSK